jgi:hypothetical protein
MQLQMFQFIHTRDVTMIPLLAPLVAVLPSKVVPEGLLPTAALEHEGSR